MLGISKSLPIALLSMSTYRFGKMGVLLFSSSALDWRSVTISGITTGWGGADSGGAAVLAIFLTVKLKCQQTNKNNCWFLLWLQKKFPAISFLSASHNHVSQSCWCCDWSFHPIMILSFAFRNGLELTHPCFFRNGLELIRPCFI